MARSKNATALFEVIHTAKKPPKSSTTVSVPTPKWWAKSKPTSDKPADAIQTAGRQGSWLAAAKRGALPVTPASAECSDSELTGVTAGAVEHITDLPALDAPVADPTDVDEQLAESHVPTEPKLEIATKPRFAERFAERFARKAASAAAVAPPVRVEIPPTAPAIEAAAEELEIEAPEPVSELNKVRRSGDDITAVAIDRRAREVQFRLSYGGLISLAFILILVIALAVLIGSHFSGALASNTQDVSGRQPSEREGNVNLLALGSSTPTIAGNVGAKTAVNIGADSGPTVGRALAALPRPDVLSVTRHPSRPPANLAMAPHSADVAQPSAQAPAQSPSQSSPPLSQTREVGAIYLVVQSYDDREIAQKACDFLSKKKGVRCSLVQGLKDWAPHDWYCVVGLQPFTAHDPNLREYQRKVTAWGQEFSNKVYNQFEPKPYTWQADSDSHSSEDVGN